MTRVPRDSTESAQSGDGTTSLGFLSHSAILRTHYGTDPGSPSSGKSADSKGKHAQGKPFKYIPNKKLFVDSTRFALLMSFAVSVNIITIGLETDMGHVNPDLFNVINNCFLLLYITELMLRLMARGLYALKDVLTVLDMFLVVFAFIERVVTRQGLARALPAFRLFRIFRVLTRTKYFRHSRELLVTTATTFKMAVSLSWTCVVLGAFLWAMSSFSHFVLGESAAWVGTMDPLEEHEAFEPFDNREYFGSVARSFFTLMQVLTCAQWADHIARPVAEVYPAMTIFFFCMICTISFGLMKSIISNILIDSMRTSRNVDKAIAIEKEQDRMKAAEHARNIFKKYDVDGDGTLDLEEITEALKSDGGLGHILFVELQVPKMDAEGLMFLFDKDSSGCVEYEEMLDVLAKMDNDLEPKDISMLNLWAWCLMMKAASIHDRLEKVAAQTAQLTKTLEGAFHAVDHFLRTKESSELRRRALEQIRTASLEGAPTLIGTVEEKWHLPTSDMAGAFISFARRFLGEANSPQTSRTERSRLRATAASMDSPFWDESDDESSLLSSRAQLLPDAPPAFHLQVMEAMASSAEREYRPMKAYDMVNAKPSPKMTQLRNLLSMSPK